MRNPWLAALACGALAIGAAGCGGDDSDSSGGGGGGDLSGPVTIDGSSTVFPFAQAAAEGFQGENSGVKVTVGESGHRRRLREVLRRRDRHLRRLAADRRGRGSADLQEERHRVLGGPGRQRRHRRRLEPVAEDRVPDHRPAEVALEEGLERHELRPARQAASRRARSRSTAPAPTPARSTSSPRRSTARRATRAPTTSPPRTTTSSSRASPATRPRSATSASRTTRTTRTS